jgi:predicted RNase H-like HicB family nuclease
MNNYTAVIVKSGKWYAGFVKELPGAHSQGKTIEEVKENLKEAVKMVLDSNYQHATQGYGDVIEEQLSIEV